MTEIIKLTRPKTVPLRSICLRKIDEYMPNHQLICHCDMCVKYQQKKVAKMLQIKTKNITDKIFARSKNKHGVCTTFYMWVIKHLVTPQNKIIKKGLDIYIPEILFYKDGQAKKMYCLKEVDEPIVRVAHKEKLSNTFILKIFGDRRRKYRQIVNTFLGKKKQVVVKKPLFGDKKQVKKEPKDGVIIKYTDNLQQLISQNQFLYLLQRRKQDPIWRQIYYIKNYISVQDPLNRIIISKFDSEDIKYVQMYTRAKTLMRVYGQNIQIGDKNFISDKQQSQFCQELCKLSLQTFADYFLYKIVCFVQYFHDEKITKIAAKFLINQMGQIYLQDVLKLNFISQIKFQWTNQTYLKKIDQEQQRVFFSKTVHTNQKIQQHAAQIKDYMGKVHEKMKQYFGLSMVQEDDTQQKANDSFFKLIHPQITAPISQILKNSGMTVDKFKKDFLGYKPQKKPIVKPFNSNMIKSLHNMTPQLHRAQAHQFVKAPKRTVSTAFNRSASRSYSTNSSYIKRNFSHNKNHSAFSTKIFTAFSSPPSNQK